MLTGDTEARVQALEEAFLLLAAVLEEEQAIPRPELGRRMRLKADEMTGHVDSVQREAGRRLANLANRIPLGA